MNIEKIEARRINFYGKKYLARIIKMTAKVLQIISKGFRCAGAKVKITNIKYLKSNKVFFYY